jgi:hypothetical protein
MQTETIEREIYVDQDRCDSKVIESPKDDLGVPCGGKIDWATERITEDHYQQIGECADCGSVYVRR